MLRLSRQAALKAGRSLRDKVPRKAHSEWIVPPRRPDPIRLLQGSDRGRLAELLPIRYGRMWQSPFSFFRGSAAVMAWDLSTTPTTQIQVQACGDCHAANFGGFASPERRLLFDINDFDETLPAPWEWDVKRLAASVVLASQERGMSTKDCRNAALAVAQSYRVHMQDYAGMSALDVWYSHIDAEVFLKESRTTAGRQRWRKIEERAKHQTSEHVFPKIAGVVKGKVRIMDHPPLVYHPSHSNLVRKHVVEMFHRYRDTLAEERRIVLDRYQIVDVARKVVGVGSVGTRCAVVLLMASEDDPLLLQFKEALPSVLEPYVRECRFANHGKRVVVGQRMLQSASDVFLGWTCDEENRSYYFRQLRDMRMKIDLVNMTGSDWLEYVSICGWALARAHARTGNPAMISGYLGKSDRFDLALAQFAISYSAQVESDYAALVKAIRQGRLKAS